MVYCIFKNFSCWHIQFAIIFQFLGFVKYPTYYFRCSTFFTGDSTVIMTTMNFQLRQHIAWLLFISLGLCTLQQPGSSAQSDSLIDRQSQLLNNPSPSLSSDTDHDKNHKLLVPLLGPGQSAPSLIRREKTWKKWTAEEEERLMELREKQVPWNEVVKSFPERNWKALVTKYNRLAQDPSAPKTERAKLWTPEENQRLLELKETGASRSWGEIAESFPGRSQTAVKSHYASLTKDRSVPTSVYVAFTTEEDELLLNLENKGMSFEEMTNHFENRSTASLRARHYTLNSAEGRSYATWTEEDDNELKRAVEANFSWEEMSELFERSVPAVKWRVLKLEKSGQINDVVQQKEKKVHYTASDVQLIHEMRENDMSWEDIARIHFPGRSIQGLKQKYSRHQKKNRNKSN